MVVSELMFGNAGAIVFLPGKRFKLIEGNAQNEGPWNGSVGGKPNLVTSVNQENDVPYSLQADGSLKSSGYTDGVYYEYWVNVSDDLK